MPQNSEPIGFPTRTFTSFSELRVTRSSPLLYELVNGSLSRCVTVPSISTVTLDGMFQGIASDVGLLISGTVLRVLKFHTWHITLRHTSRWCDLKLSPALSGEWFFSGLADISLFLVTLLLELFTQQMGFDNRKWVSTPRVCTHGMDPGGALLPLAESSHAPRVCAAPRRRVAQVRVKSGRGAFSRLSWPMRTPGLVSRQRWCLAGSSLELLLF